MRIDRYMTPQEAQKWWRDNGGGRNAGTKPVVREWYPRHNTPQERYRLRKKIMAERVIKVLRTSNETLAAFERGDVKELSDIGWLRLAAFYGLLVKSVKVMRKTVLWERYLEEYGKLADESEHRRIRIAARAVIVAHDRARDAKAKKKQAEPVHKPAHYYRQASLCTGGIY